jgi:hypothetical protein
MKSGAGIIFCVTRATDLAVDAANQMLGAFPDDKVAAIKEKFAKYNELKAKRGDDGALDNDSEMLATQGLDATAALRVEDYRKDKAGVVRPAYLKMGLALGIDALAAIQLPAFLKSSVDTINSLKSNPLQANKAFKLVMIAKTGAIMVKEVPSQYNSIKTVRAIAEKIAQAENVKLGDAPKVTELSAEAMHTSEQSIPAEG